MDFLPDAIEHTGVIIITSDFPMDWTQSQIPFKLTPNCMRHLYMIRSYPTAQCQLCTHGCCVKQPKMSASWRIVRYWYCGRFMPATQALIPYFVSTSCIISTMTVRTYPSLHDGVSLSMDLLMSGCSGGLYARSLTSAHYVPLILYAFKTQ